MDDATWFFWNPTSLQWAGEDIEGPETTLDELIQKHAKLNSYGDEDLFGRMEYAYAYAEEWDDFTPAMTLDAFKARLLDTRAARRAREKAESDAEASAEKARSRRHLAIAAAVVVAFLILLGAVNGTRHGDPTAECRDGTMSFFQNNSGTCSWHGGVARWIPAGSDADDSGSARYDNTSVEDMAH